MISSEEKIALIIERNFWKLEDEGQNLQTFWDN